MDIVPTIAYKFDEQWSVGLGFQAQYMKAAFTNFDGPYTGIPAIDALVAATNPTNLKASGWGFGAIFGVLFKPDLCTRIGLSYRTQVSEALSGDGQQYTLPGGTVPAPSPDFLSNAQTSVQASTRTPAVLSLGIARDFGDWTVKATGQVNFWNSLNQLTINMPQAFATSSTIVYNWKNAWFGALGADYRANSVLTLRGGFAYDQTPTKGGYRDPRIPDADRYWLTAGVTYLMTRHLSVDGAYEHIFFPDQTVNVTQASGVSATSTLPLEVNQVSAKYKGSADIVALALRYSF
jgi:long-chain fatty acid transport protein